jgi:hypothetical protein
MADLKNKTYAPLSVDSRQQKRARARKACFADVTKRYGPEPRKARRGIALSLARKSWRVL